MCCLWGKAACSACCHTHPFRLLCIVSRLDTFAAFHALPCTAELLKDAVALNRCQTIGVWALLDIKEELRQKCGAPKQLFALYFRMNKFAAFEPFEDNLRSQLAAIDPGITVELANQATSLYVRINGVRHGDPGCYIVFPEHFQDFNTHPLVGECLVR